MTTEGNYAGDTRGVNIKEYKFEYEKMADHDLKTQQVAARNQLKKQQDNIDWLKDQLERQNKKITTQDNMLEAANETVNYTGDQVTNLEIHRLENDTKDMARAARDTIQTLQKIIDEKSEELDHCW